MSTEQLADRLVPVAAQLVGAVHDYGPDAIADVLAQVPDGRLDALAVVLAAMVDPDRSPAALLAWTQPAVRPQEPPRSAAPPADTSRAEFDRLRRAGVTVHAAAVLAHARSETAA